MSNFEPNAVIRGFQLTVVGSMSPYMFCCFPRPFRWIGLKTQAYSWLHTQFYECQGRIASESAYAKTLIKVLAVQHWASHLLSFALE